MKRVTKSCGWDSLATVSCGNINASTGELLGQVQDPRGNGLLIDGIWGLLEGEAEIREKKDHDDHHSEASSEQRVFFAAGINAEADGLVGVLVERQKECSVAAAEAPAVAVVAAAASSHVPSFLSAHLPKWAGHGLRSSAAHGSDEDSSSSEWLPCSSVLIGGLRPLAPPRRGRPHTDSHPSERDISVSIDSL